MNYVYIFLFYIVLFFSSCKEINKDISTNDVTNTQTADGSTNQSLPDIKFEEETHDFGRITEVGLSSSVTGSFAFKAR